MGKRDAIAYKRLTTCAGQNDAESAKGKVHHFLACLHVQMRVERDNINNTRGGRRLDVWGGGRVAKGPLSSLGGPVYKHVIYHSIIIYQHLIIEYEEAHETEMR